MKRTVGGLALITIMLSLAMPARRLTASTDVDGVTCFQTYVAMRDGVLLNTKVFLLNLTGGGPYPAVVCRTVYGIGGNDTTWRPSGFPVDLSSGYAYVMQDVRGMGYSQGVNRIFYDDGQDGYDTVEWVASQPWCNGKVGLYGVSADGMTAYLAAGLRPPHLVACLVEASSANFYNDFLYDGNAFRFGDFMLWLIHRTQSLSQDDLAQVVPAAEQPNIPQYLRDCDRVYVDMLNHTGISSPNSPLDSAYYMHLPLEGFNPSFSVLMPWIDEILSHPSEDAFRDQLNAISGIDVPTMHVGGWYDMFAKSAIDAFMGLQPKGNQMLVMTGGTHDNMGATPYGATTGAMAWFDYWLRGVDDGIMNHPPVAYYCIGPNQWRYADTWPPHGTQQMEYYFHSNGSLDTAPCGSLEQPDAYLYDPANPVLTYGGRNLSPYFVSGDLDQRAVEHGRSDILMYRSAPLSADMEVTGPVNAVLSVWSNCTETDFTAKLIDVYPNGTEALVLDGIMRARYRDSPSNPVLMQPGTNYGLQVSLGDTSYVFDAGHSIQVDVSSSNFPKYDRNLNTGGQLYNETSYNIAHNVVRHDSQNLSYIVLSISNSTPDTTPPVINSQSHIPAGGQVEENNTVMVQADVTDVGSGVNSTILSYSFDGITWTKVTMTYNGGEGLWTGIIPAFNNDTQVWYIIYAVDNAGNAATPVEDTYTVQTQPIPEFNFVMLATLLTMMTATIVTLRKRPPRVPRRLV